MLAVNKYQPVAGYAPHTATLPDGSTMKVAGQYPYADNVTLSVKRTASSTGEEWSLALRIPCWVDAAQVLTLTSFLLTASLVGLTPPRSAAICYDDHTVGHLVTFHIQVTSWRYCIAQSQVHMLLSYSSIPGTHGTYCIAQSQVHIIV